MIEIKIEQAANSLKEIITAIKNSNSKEVTVDPVTGTFMKDGFVAKGMQTYDNDRVRHTEKFQAFDLGFCIICIDPKMSSTKIVFDNGSEEEIKFNEEFL